jgi:hypothetical protein
MIFIWQRFGDCQEGISVVSYPLLLGDQLIMNESFRSPCDRH